MSNLSMAMIWILAAGLVASGCAGADDAQVAGDDDPEGLATAVAGEKWNTQNSPTVFTANLEYKLDALPKEGRSERTPWPDTYWPTYEDSINSRWQVSYGEATLDTLSPAEKYDMAFNGWKPDEAFLKLKPYSSGNCADKSWDKEYYAKLGPAAKYVSDYKGNDKARNGIDDDGDGSTDECDDRDGVETWWGLCHAWVPAAILTDEPQKAVVHNGVKFEVADMKALMQMMHDRSNAVLVGGRCNDKEVKRDDKTGRILADQCRDVNPGTYHVIMANYLGVMKRAIAEDRTYDYQVWNQPILGWRVNDMKEVTDKEAMKLLGLPDTVTKYPHNPDAKKIFEVRATTQYITESYPGTEPLVPSIDDYTREDDYHYLLEVDKNGKIIGGEWLGESHTNHPDFLWNPIAAGGGTPSIKMSDVKMLVEKSRKTEPEAPAGDVKTYQGTTAVEIPDNNTTGVFSAIAVADTGKVGAFVEVDVDIEHTYIGDLKVSLVHGGRTVTLSSNEGGSAKNLKKTFNVKDFTDSDTSGEWKLLVADTASADTGKIVSWTLRIAYQGSTTPAATSLKGESADTPLDIPDDNATGISSTITLAAGTVAGVQVAVEISHSYVGALVVTLKHGGKSRVLSNQEGAGGTSIVKTWEVKDFDGADAAGDWILHVKDIDAYGDTGKLLKWNIEVAL